MKKKNAYILTLLAMLFWAFSFVWTKQAYESIEPITLIIFRLIISIPLLFALGLLRHPIKRIARKDLKWFVLLGFCEPFVYFMGECFALKLISSSLTAAIIATVPLLCGLTSLFFLKEGTRWQNIIGMLVSFFGIAGLSLIDAQSNGKESLLGIALIFAAAFAAVGYSILLKKLTVRYNSTSIVLYQNIVGIVLTAPFFFIFEWEDLVIANITDGTWVAVINLSVFASVLAFTFFSDGLKVLGVAKANALVNIIPILTALIAFYYLQEPLPLHKVALLIIVSLGLYISQGRGKLSIKKAL